MNRLAPNHQQPRRVLTPQPDSRQTGGIPVCRDPEAKNPGTLIRALALVAAMAAPACFHALAAPPHDLIAQPYQLDSGLQSRSISFENPTGAPGQGGQAASKLGVGRKGSPARSMKPGDAAPLCDIKGSGTIRHIWITMYRWHLPDPVFWQEECRITIQQIGWKDGLYERQDDWSCATFWYEPVPSAPLPPMPDLPARTRDLWKESGD